MKWNQIFFVIILMSLFSACNLTKSNLNKQIEIFRYIDIGGNRIIRLGDKVDLHIGYLHERENDYFQIIGGPFGGQANEIFIYVDKHNRISKFEFIYDKSIQFENQVESYKETIGSPKKNAKNKSIWEDSKTKFILFQSEGNVVIAELIDKGI